MQKDRDNKSMIRSCVGQLVHRWICSPNPRHLNVTLNVISTKVCQKTRTAKLFKQKEIKCSISSLSPGCDLRWNQSEILTCCVLRVLVNILWQIVCSISLHLKAELPSQCRVRQVKFKSTNTFRDGIDNMIKQNVSVQPKILSTI